VQGSAHIKISHADVRRKISNFKSYDFSRGVLSGDWDLNTSLIEDNEKFRSVRQRFVQGVAWEHTDIFRGHYAQRFSRGEVVRGCRTEAELLSFYSRRMDKMYLDIKKNGIRAPGLFNRIEPLYVYVGRTGELLWGSGGNHRFAMAKLLQLEDIPVRVRALHSDFKVTDSFLKSFGLQV